MKRVTFSSTRPSVSSAKNVDDWVSNHESDQAQAQAQAVPKEAMKRLTIDVPLSLHRRIKSQCALGELIMADEIRSLLEHRFPAEPRQETVS